MRLSFAHPVVATTIGLALFVGKAQHAISQHSPRKLKLAFLANNAADYWTVVRKGVEKADKELGIEVDFQTPSQGTAAQQTQILNDLLSKGTQGIAMSPVDPENQVDLINAAAKKALIFTQDTDDPKSKRACYVGSDNVAAGRQAGEELKRALPRGGDVMVFVGKRDAQNALDRVKGLAEGIAGGKIRILGVRTDQADRTTAKANVSDALVKHPHLAACVGIWSYNGPAILSALQDANKTRKVKVVCFDEEPDTLTGVKNGEISATIVQQPFQIGYLSIITMAKYLSGDKTVIPASHRLLIPTLAIHRDNVAAFKKQLDQWRR